MSILLEILAELGFVVGEGTGWKKSRVLMTITAGFILVAIILFLFIN